VEEGPSVSTPAERALTYVSPFWHFSYLFYEQVGKLLGEEWKKLSAEDKAPYEAQAAKDKERYAAAMADYKAAGGGAADGAAGDADDADGEDAGGDDEAAE
jgi:hypothetical protein